MSDAPDPPAGTPSHPADMLSAARLAAVQGIYQMEMTGVAADTVVTEFVFHRGGAELDDDAPTRAPDKALFSELVRGVAQNREALDGAISALLVADWPITRIEKVMVAILRAGAFELLHRPAVPARVVVNEYVDVAHAFFDAKEAGMVNGVLDRMARDVRAAEMGSHGRAPKAAG